MVERSHQLNLLRQQHAVTEHVTGHVTDAGHGKEIGLDVDTLFLEVSPNCLPGAPSRDAHLLVVVAGGAAGCKGIIEPEAVVTGYAVRDV